MSLLIGLPRNTDISSCPVSVIANAASLELCGVKYYDFVSLVSHVTGFLQDERHHGNNLRKASVQLRRVRDSFNRGPWVDELPDEFAEKLVLYSDEAIEELSGKWFLGCSFGHGMWTMEPKMLPMSHEIVTFARNAIRHDMDLYFVQRF